MKPNTKTSLPKIGPQPLYQGPVRKDADEAGSDPQPEEQAELHAPAAAGRKEKPRARKLSKSERR